MARLFNTYTIALLLLFLVTACGSNRPRPDSASIEVPESFSADGEIMGSAAFSGLSVLSKETGEWWRGFGDPRLNELMDQLFEGNLNIAMAYERLNKARALMFIENGAEGPNLTLGANGGRSRTVAGTADTYRASAAASYEIDLWGRFAAKSKATRKEMEATAGDLKAIYITLSAELVELYYLGVERSLQHGVATRMVEVAGEKLSLSEQRYREGLVSARELYVAREGLATAKARRPSIESEIAGAGHSVSVLTGRVPKAGASNLFTGSNHLPLPPRIPVLLPSQLVNRRPDLSASLLRVESNDHRVAVAIADRFPSFSLTGEYGGASSSLSSLLDSPNILWNLLVQATAPVLDGGRRRAEVKRTEALFNESLLQYRQNLLVALKEVEDALNTNRAAIVGLPLSVAKREAADGALNVTVQRYRNGVGDYMDVLTERQRLYEAQSGELSAERALISARLSLIRSLGGDFMEAAVQKRVDENRSAATRMRETFQIEEIN